MKKIKILFSVLFFFIFSHFFSQGKYIYKVDLRQVKEDKLKVTLKVPGLNSSNSDFLFPSIVPGTYAIYDFGRFISDFKAFNKDGSEAKFVKKDINTYSFSDIQSLGEIQYWVEDSWDTKNMENFVFEPAGTNIEENKNFVLNTHGFFGYFKGTERFQFELEINKPSGFYASTGIDNVIMSDLKDVFQIENYYDLVDAPIMYCMPDTSIVRVGNTSVLISLYSPNKSVSSKFISSTIKEILFAQQDYLGGKLPVSKYAFIIYLTDKPTGSGASGALEHSYSSFYLLPEMDTMYLAQTMRDVAAHEFFHIVTPLNIHSEEIGSFKFNEPKMSQHLWLYEGLTEYNAHHMQVKHKLIDVPYFLQVMKSKIEESRTMYNDTLPFTLLSKKVLNEYKDQYVNVYAKGALIGMCLDVILRDWSKGKYGTQELMRDLSLKYGKNNSFKDEELFYDIEKLTCPEVKDFLEKYVNGSNPLPFEQIFDKVGYRFLKEREVRKISFGDITFDYNPKSKRIILYVLLELSEFGKKMGFKNEDELVSFQGQTVTLENFESIFMGFIENVKEGETVTIQVARKRRFGRNKIITLKSDALFEIFKDQNVILEMEKINETQELTRNSWLGL